MGNELLLAVLNVIHGWEIEFHALEVQGPEEEGIWC